MLLINVFEELVRFYLLTVFHIVQLHLKITILSFKIAAGMHLLYQSSDKIKQPCSPHVTDYIPELVRRATLAVTSVGSRNQVDKLTTDLIHLRLRLLLSESLPVLGGH